MDHQQSDASATRFSAYLDALASVIGHAARVGPMRDYCTGLLLPCGRKSVEPMAALTAPARVGAQHQKLLHFIAEGGWSDADVLAKVRAIVLPVIEKQEAIKAWIIDDTGFPKHGLHSVGVSHQYCGQVGKQANCQVAVSLSVANHHASLPIAYQLYLTETWAKDKARRADAGIPDEVTFKTKPKIALQHIEWACAAGIPPGVVLMDSAYGSDLSLRTRMTALGLSYSVGVWARTLVRKIAGKTAKQGAKPMTAGALAASLPSTSWQTIGWRNGTNTALASRFARVRVAAAGEGTGKSEPEEWLLIEWPEDEKEATKFWLSSLPKGIDFTGMVDITMMRWRIERDYLELKQEVGPNLLETGLFEGRGWRGFHHHATMCIAAYGFLVSERGAFPPWRSRSRFVSQEFAIPESYRPRGAAAPP